MTNMPSNFQPISISGLQVIGLQRSGFNHFGSSVNGPESSSVVGSGPVAIGRPQLCQMFHSDWLSLENKNE